MNAKDQGEKSAFKPFKKHEHVLMSKVEPFSRKIESIIAIWKALSQPEQQKLNVGSIIQIVDWAKLHTLYIVLTGEWKDYKETSNYETQLLSEVEKTQNELLKISNVFSKKFQKLSEVIKNPWDDPVLKHLLHDGNAKIGQREIDFFCVETAYLVSVRLKKLCESQCEDMALNLVTAFMNCYNLSVTQQFSLNATTTHIQFCFDINIALLFRYERKSEILGMFKKLPLEEGLLLIQRFAKKRVKIAKVWKNFPHITFLACQVYVTTAMMKAFNESGAILRALLKEWTEFSSEFNLIENFVDSMRKIIHAATAAQHIYVCCEIIQAKFGLKLRTFLIELYIRALTTDMNNVESQKNENNKEELEETNKRLASGFVNLSDILTENIEVCRESALTAFSLDPTIERLRKIEQLAKLSGYNVLDTGQIWECRLHPPVKPEDELCYICNLCGKWMSKCNIDFRLTTNLALNEALNFKILGISPQLCDDLAVVLSGPRYHLLSWLLRWEDLHKLCEMYLNDPERTKNLVTELKFVDIDYSMFAEVKKEPIDEYAGIERGYEGFLHDDQNTRAEEEEEEEEQVSLPSFPTKSDPNTLKTLRMFRHNNNRSKTKPATCNSKEQCNSPSSIISLYNTDQQVINQANNFGSLSSSRTFGDYDREIPNALYSSGDNNQFPYFQGKRNLDTIDLSQANLDNNLNRTNTNSIKMSSVKNKDDGYRRSFDGSHSPNPKPEFFKKYKPTSRADQETPPKKRQKIDLRNWRSRLSEKKSKSHKSCKHSTSSDSDITEIGSCGRLKISPEDSRVFSSARSTGECRKDVPSNSEFNTPLEAHIRPKPRPNERDRSKVLADVDENTLESADSNSSDLDKANYSLINGCLENIEKIYKCEKNISNKHKELKIIINRLSSEVLKRFIPSYSSDYVRDCLCGCENTPGPDADENCVNPTTNREASNEKKDRTGSDVVDKNKLNPRVVIERLRLPLDTAYARAILANVPGLNDFEMIRPGNVNHIVNVVQIPGNMVSSTASVQNTHVSTQITPHIQRIGQPKSDKNENVPDSKSNISSTTSTTPSSSTVKTTQSQSSTLINILSQQIMRPVATNNVKNRSSPLINILSQQIIRPATPQPSPKSNDGQVNSHQLNKVFINCPQVKTIQSESSNESDAVKTTSANVKTVVSTTSGTILQLICKSTLPKFQQAFGKSVYTYKSGDQVAVSVSETSTFTTEAKISQAKTQPAANIQSIQGSVIYTKQMTAGQTINLIPPGRGHLFRIASSSSDQIALVKDTVIQSKMSALLAAALQGKPKTEAASDGEHDDASQDAKTSTIRPTLVSGARIVKPVLQIPSNVIRTCTSPQANLSSTTLEQLREFDMVYKQVQERSSSTSVTESNAPEVTEGAHRISVTYVNSTQKYAQLSPVVVVTSYCNLQSVSSPALSVTSQNNQSPCVTSASTTPLPKLCTKSPKGKSGKQIGQASKASPVAKPQHKLQEDEQTTQRIFDILAEYAEQLRNSPDLNNKPAPRRRSNPPTNSGQSTKRKKTSMMKKSCLSESDLDDQKTIESEDSSCGVVQLSVQEDESNQTTQTLSSESGENFSNARQLILSEGTNNNARNLIIADSSVGEALKIPNTAVLVPGNYIMPVSMVKSGQQIAVVSGGSKILATVPGTRSGPNMLLFQSFLNHDKNKTIVPTVKYSSIQTVKSQQPTNRITSNNSHVIISQQDAQHTSSSTVESSSLLLKTVQNSDRGKTESVLAITKSLNSINRSAVSSSDSITSSSDDISKDENSQHENTSHNLYERSTPVIAQNSSADNDDNRPHAVKTADEQSGKSHLTKSVTRLQSMLVTSCSSENAPMLSTRKPVEMVSSLTETTTKSECIHNGEKMSKVSESKQFSSTTSFLVNKPKRTNVLRLDREQHQLYIQRKQTVLDREMRLQKSLSEECEDLGVDEPSTSDLFPEADILFDASHSPSFDHSSQDVVKKSVAHDKDDKSPDIINKNKIFDDNATARTAFLFGPVEHANRDVGPEFHSQMTNGQRSNKPKIGHILQTNDVQCHQHEPSPASPVPYQENFMQNKYKIQYSNRRKGEKHKNAVDSISSNEVITNCKSVGQSETCDHVASESCMSINHDEGFPCEDDKSEMESKSMKIDQNCDDVVICEDGYECSLSGRGARRSVKKMCSCCKGSQNNSTSRKRPSSSPQAPVPHKKAFLSKKR